MLSKDGFFIAAMLTEIVMQKMEYFFQVISITHKTSRLPAAQTNHLQDKKPQH